MKKKILILTTILSATTLLFSSCLKDNSHFVDFSKGGTFVDFPLGGFANFSSEAITEAAGSDPNGSVTRKFAVNVASVNLPTAPTTVTIGIGDANDVATINKLQSNVIYTLMPANAYVLAATKVTIPAGQQYAETSVTIYKNLLDPSLSYVLPVKITDGGGQKISANLNVLYYHVIGNDFAGADVWDYYRYNNFTTAPPPGTPLSGGSALGQAGQISPVTPNEFQMYTGYNGNGVHYDVTFTKSTVNGQVVYSNWAVKFVPSDVTNIWGPLGITVASGPVFQVLDPANKTFTLQYVAFNGTAYRYIIDSYHP